MPTMRLAGRVTSVSRLGCAIAGLCFATACPNKENPFTGDQSAGSATTSKPGSSAAVETAPGQPEVPANEPEAIPDELVVMVAERPVGYRFTIKSAPDEEGMLVVAGCETRTVNLPCKKANTLEIDRAEFDQLWSGKLPSPECETKTVAKDARRYTMRWGQAANERVGYLPSDPKRIRQPSSLVNDPCNPQAPFVALTIAGFESADFGERDETAH